MSEEGSQFEREEHITTLSNEIFNTLCEACERLSNPDEMQDGKCPDCQEL